MTTEKKRIKAYLRKIPVGVTVTRERINKVAGTDWNTARNIVEELIEIEVFEKVPVWSSDGNIGYMKIKDMLP